MPTKDKRFEVTVTLSVQQIKGSVPTPFFDSSLAYHEIPYEGVVMVEQALLEMLNKLGEAGLEQAQGDLREKLKSLGIGKKD